MNPSRIALLDGDACFVYFNKVWEMSIPNVIYS